MIHPNTLIKTVSPHIGNGVFATARIPQGTIVVVRDSFDIVLTQQEFQDLPQLVHAMMETHLYRDKHGNLILSWDHAKYMNHSCCSNTMMTDYGFEIAVREILPGEQVTSDYGLLNVLESYPVECTCPRCCQGLQVDDIDNYADEWDVQIKQSMLLIPCNQQPLLDLLSDMAKQQLDEFLQTPTSYRSVRNLKWRPADKD
jgi:hypothetical protein